MVENAVKYSPKGAEVALSAVCDAQAVIFKVVDQGPGIDTAIKEKIFDEFYSQHIENHTKGTALSLAIGKEIMNLHQGSLCVESILEQGATFIFSFPVTLASKL